MNPLDKSWEFLKAPVDDKKFRFEQKQRDNDAAAQKKKARDAKTAETRQEKLNLGPNMRESGPYPGFNSKLRAEIEARNKKARENLEEEAEGPKYPNPPTSEPSQSNLVSSTGINDPHDPRTMQPRRGA
tara:strand:+ start:149 stop:535 length:387 start_codon:yes stop_codon:yes gene_type:complete